MKAFLSYSSKDDYFVSEVAKQLGITQYEYDRRTFEHTLNVAAITQALARCDIYVLFLSQHSLTSSFVAEEQRQALEARGKGTIRRIVIFAIDGTSYSALPSWLKEINVVTHISSQKICARKIQAMLVEVQAVRYGKSSIYVGRAEEEKSLRRALALPPGKCPVAVHIVGHHGVGRRTLLRKVFFNVFPRSHELVEVALSRFQSIEDLYRQLYDLHVISSLQDTIKAFDDFGAMSEKEQCRLVAEFIGDLAEQDEFVLVIDDGGVYTDAGDYQDYMGQLITTLTHHQRPIIGFIQTRMMPASTRAKYTNSHHQFVRELDDENTQELLSFTLKHKEVHFTESQLKQAISHLDGHPYNIEFFAVLAASYGIESVLLDPSDLIEWKARRAEDFISKLKFTKSEIDILSALVEYPYLALDLLLAATGADAATAAKSLRNLEDNCCIERRQHYYVIATSVREAVRRNKAFSKSDSWRKSLATKICDALKEYRNEDHVRVAVIESATLAALRAGGSAPILPSLVLPSHLLRCAREMYDSEKRAQCIEFCKRALQMNDRLTKDGQIEALRLWGLSAARSGPAEDLDRIVDQLNKYKSRVAQRVALFLKGFRARLAGRLDEAEEKFLDAWELDQGNLSINRELASLYCKQRRYADAEEYARAAYRVAPTNPYILDVITESLLGKLHSGLPVNTAELNDLLNQLKIYGDAPGSSFYLIREAHRLLKDKHYADARISIDRAITRTPALLPPYFMRAEICLAQRDIAAAERDLATINKLLADAGGFAEGDEQRVAELKIKIHIERRQYRLAKKALDLDAFLSSSHRARLSVELAKAIGFDPSGADAEMKQWASGSLRERSSRPRKTRR